MDKRKEEVDRVMMTEGELCVGPVEKVLESPQHTSHAPALLCLKEQAAVGSHALEVTEVLHGKPDQVDLVCGPDLLVGSTGKAHLPGLVFSNYKHKGGVQNRMVKPSNQHIHFFSDEEVSDFSDSVEELEGNEQRILKLRQRNRKKKKSISLAKKHSGPVLEEFFEKTPKSGKGDKKCYQGCSTHRRTVSLPVGREEDWSEGEIMASGFGRGGGRISSLEPRLSQGSGVGLMFTNKADLEGESLLRKDEGRGGQSKVLAAKKELVIQKKAGVSHSMKEGGIIDKLMEMEDKAVKLKASKEGVTVF